MATLRVIAMTDEAAQAAMTSCALASRKLVGVAELQRLHGRPTSQIDAAISWLDWLGSMVKNAPEVEADELVSFELPGMTQEVTSDATV